MYPFKELGFPPYRNNAITSILCDFGMQRKASNAWQCSISHFQTKIMPVMSYITFSWRGVKTKANYLIE